jgi:hypothetical protein
MAVYTYNTTAAEDTALQWMLDRENERRARNGQGAINLTQLFTGGTKKLWVREYGEQRDTDREQLRRAFSAAPSTAQDTVRVTLGPYIDEDS